MRAAEVTQMQEAIRSAVLEAERARTGTDPSRGETSMPNDDGRLGVYAMLCHAMSSHVMLCHAMPCCVVVK